MHFLAYQSILIDQLEFQKAFTVNVISQSSQTFIQLGFLVHYSSLPQFESFDFSGTRTAMAVILEHFFAYWHRFAAKFALRLFAHFFTCDNFVPNLTNAFPTGVRWITASRSSLRSALRNPKYDQTIVIGIPIGMIKASQLGKALVS